MRHDRRDPLAERKEKASEAADGEGSGGQGEGCRCSHNLQECSRELDQDARAGLAQPKA
jgi:hypothetical protein